MTLATGGLSPGIDLSSVIGLPRPFLNFVWIENRAWRSPGTAQYGTSPVPRGEPVTRRGSPSPFDLTPINSGPFLGRRLRPAPLLQTPLAVGYQGSPAIANALARYSR